VTDETAVEEANVDEQSGAPETEMAPEGNAETAAEATDEANVDAAAQATADTTADADMPATDEAAVPAEAPRRERGDRGDRGERGDRGGSKKQAEVQAAAGPASNAAVNEGLRVRYRDEVVPALKKEFGYTNPMQVPRLSKIVVNIGLGEALQNAKALDAAVGDLTSITGQKPIVTRARRSIAQFRLRTGNPIGAKVTLRGQRMWDFLERLTRLALPRIRDFRGVPSKSFDGRGNYSLGLREQLAFPEIDYDKIDRLRGLEVSIVTTAKTDEESKRLLQLLGMPFAGQNG
jgi:large subunit ribosomal protein L5